LRRHCPHGIAWAVTARDARIRRRSGGEDTRASVSGDGARAGRSCLASGTERDAAPRMEIPMAQNELIALEEQGWNALSPMRRADGWKLAFHQQTPR